MVLQLQAAPLEGAMATPALRPVPVCNARNANTRYLQKPGIVMPMAELTVGRNERGSQSCMETRASRRRADTVRRLYRPTKQNMSSRECCTADLRNEISMRSGVSQASRSY